MHNKENNENFAKNRARRNHYFLTIVNTVIGLISILLIVLILLSVTHRKPEGNVLPKELEVATTSDSTITISKEDYLDMLEQVSENAADARENELKAQIVNQMAQKDPNTSEMLRKLFPDKIVYIAEDGYHFDPISYTMPSNPYDNKNIVIDDNGIYSYVENGENKSLFGIDVSYFQGEINWDEVVNADTHLDFVFVRAGFRGYDTGKLIIDEQFENNMRGLSENNIDTGVYFFSQAINEEEVLEEIDFLMEALKDYDITYPVVLDVEKLDSPKARGMQLSKEERTHLTRLFLDKVAENGYHPMLYGNTYSLFAMLDMEQLKDIDVWYAFYDKYIYYPYNLKCWQYSDTVSIPGIKGNADVDIFFK